eukprot:13548277-Alexandrium_andersonii.AAC.1
MRKEGQQAKLLYVYAKRASYMLPARCASSISKLDVTATCTSDVSKTRLKANRATECASQVCRASVQEQY